MERKNLVIVRAGTESQHHKWIDKTESERNFDIVALSYGHQEDFFIKGSHDLFHYVPGPKLKGYQDWLQTNDHIFSKYNYIALLDDDIHTSHNDLDRLFAYCQALNISLAQPALTTDSYYSLLITRQHESFLHRWTNWVEIMAPFFKAELLRKCLKTFSLNLYGGGSLESLWPRYCDKVIGSIAIIDKIPIQHTREVGSAGSGTEGNKNQKLKHHLRRIVQIQNCFNPTFDNICGLTNEGEFLHLGELKFLQMLAYDIDKPGLEKHSKLDYNGGYKTANTLCKRYLSGAHRNFEAVNGCMPNEDFNQDLMMTSINAGATYTTLLKI